jgi:aspartyl/asparaginyl-tRNA synthetase
MINCVPVNADVARIISRQATATRSWLGQQGFVEIFPPHLTRVKQRPFMPTFRVGAPDLDFDGSLRVSANYFLAQTLSELRRAYAVTTTFRPAQDTRPSALTEFQLGELWREGDFETLLDFAESFLRSLIESLLDTSSPLSVARARELEKIRFPLPRVTYQEVVKRVGGEPGESLSGQQQSALLRTFDSSPVFITHFPADSDPCFTDMREDPDKGVRAFELRAPWAGELMSGGELETDMQALSRQVKRSRFLKELVRVGGTEEQLSAYLHAIARLAPPQSRMAFGFERLTQFLTGAETIEKASLFPVRARRQGGRIVVIIDFIVIVVEDPEPV